jgi:hypothetical protein
MTRGKIQIRLLPREIQAFYELDSKMLEGVQNLEDWQQDGQTMTNTGSAKKDKKGPTNHINPG